MKTYHGMRTEHGCSVVVEEEGEFTTLDHRADLRDLSADGIGWGRGEKGTAQLALALAADVLGDDAQALDLYLPLKYKVIDELSPHEGWVMTENYLRRTLDRCEQRQEERQERPL